MAMATASGAEEVRNKQVILKNYVSEKAEESDMHVTVSTLKLKVPQDSKAVVVKNLYLPCDPYLRLRMHRTQPPNSVFTSLTPASPLDGFGVAKILESGHPEFKEGDLVWGTTGWEEYSIITEPEQLFKIHHTDVPLSYYTGLPWHAGYNCRDYVFVSAAAGAVAQLVGQFAKLMGCYVVGSVASKEKPQDYSNLVFIFYNRIHIVGFVMFDYFHLYPKFLDMVIPYIREGKIVYLEDIAEGLESAPAALVGLFSGRNVGNQVVLVAHE